MASKLRLLKLFAFTAVLVVATLAIACGDDDDAPDPTSSASATEPVAAASPAPTRASGELLLASTTTTEDTGLLDVLIPAFEETYGYSVKLISGGSGQAIENGRRGDVDVLLVHSPDAEKKMVADGFGIERAFVMHNDFVLVGPAADPAGAKATTDITTALQAIATGESPFVSRGDDSGTHVAEVKQWTAAGIEPAGRSWYSETGQGQGATLQVASQRGAYALTDRGTFLAQRDNLDLEIVSEGSASLFNYYHVIVVSPEQHADTNVAGARAWAAFVVGERAQEIIRTFGVDEFGEPLFYPDAGKPDPTE